MIFTLAAVTTGLATIVSSITVGLLALDPVWWAEFESELAAYVDRLSAR